MKIQVKKDKRIFLLYALLNAGGYKPEDSRIHPVRVVVLDFLKNNLTTTERQKIKEFIQPAWVKKEFWFPFRMWVLSHGEPTRFKELSSSWKKVIDKKTANDLEKMLVWFWKEKGLSIIWKKVSNQYDEKFGRCKENTNTAFTLCKKYLRITNKSLPFKSFIVIPNFLEEYNRGVGPTINKTHYALLGPSRDTTNPFPVQRIQHELLHGIINPMTQKIFSKSPPRELSRMREMLIHGILLCTHRNNIYYIRKKQKYLGNQNIDITALFDLLRNTYEREKYVFEKFFYVYTQEIKEACLPK